MTSPVWRREWALSPGRCPCDLDFVDFLRSRRITGKAIFHFGTGVHHVVGRANRQTGANDILAVTASPAEHTAYADLVAEDPALALHYQVLLTDVYALSGLLLPCFDLVTLFHLHEFHGALQHRYDALDDRSLLELLYGKLTAGGLMLFYRGSDGYAGAEATVGELVDSGQLTLRGDSGSLRVYQRSGG